MTDNILRAHDVRQAGWYWWRFSDEDKWQAMRVDPGNDTAFLQIAGGQFIGPLTEPG